ncbi:hypothetical protein L2E82_38948 [Cichorium intybus]|uniref:Uncharacterized protein n=1 Tax=Cichorium intybus TaxID=13427 RepID=A0ACB9AGM8_CICIN|nr:hypothetical protein L2E82_38948 [Cichorium intybus]
MTSSLLKVVEGMIQFILFFFDNLSNCLLLLMRGLGIVLQREGFNTMVTSFAMIFKKLDEAADVSLDQLTVNEYPAGVGLSPHIDTHLAFEGSIYSLSLSGPCIMEFRGNDGDKERSNMIRRANMIKERIKIQESACGPNINVNYTSLSPIVKPISGQPKSLCISQNVMTSGISQEGSQLIEKYTCCCDRSNGE